MTYDLLLQGGHVIDPGQGIDTRLDIAIADGRIAAMAPDIPATEADTVLDVSAENRYVVPGLLDIHTHIAYGGTTKGVGMECCDPDRVGIESGVTTVVDAGSVGVANVGVFPTHLIGRSATRVMCFVNIGRYAHTMPKVPDVAGFDDIDGDSIAQCIAANPGLISGIKLRLAGPLVLQDGEKVIDRAKQVARDNGVQLMVHIGDRFGPGDVAERMAAVTRHLLENLDAGDILTHLCTPNAGGVQQDPDRMAPLLAAARERGVVLDGAVGMGNFGHRVATEQLRAGLSPDTISSDLTAMGETFQSLMECMSKYIAVGHSLRDVVAMTTTNAAKAIGRSADLGALAVGREADVTIFDAVDGDYEFTDTLKETFYGSVGLRPVRTIRAGRQYAPRWGTHPWGWLPARRQAG